MRVIAQAVRAAVDDAALVVQAFDETDRQVERQARRRREKRSRWEWSSEVCDVERMVS